MLLFGLGCAMLHTAFDSTLSAMPTDPQDLPVSTKTTFRNSRWGTEKRSPKVFADCNSEVAVD